MNTARNTFLLELWSQWGQWVYALKPEFLITRIFDAISGTRKGNGSKIYQGAYCVWCAGQLSGTDQMMIKWMLEKILNSRFATTARLHCRCWLAALSIFYRSWLATLVVTKPHHLLCNEVKHLRRSIFLVNYMDFSQNISVIRYHLPRRAARYDYWAGYELQGC